jgi:hypothetical protein
MGRQHIKKKPNIAMLLLQINLFKIFSKNNNMFIHLVNYPIGINGQL